MQAKPLNILITGANRGIGLELSRLYQQQGARVYACCRSRSAPLEALGVQVIEGIDVSSDDSVRELAAQLQGIQIDLLINNAGIFLNESLEQMNYNSIEQQFAVNALGPLRVTHALLANLAAGSKVAMITSRMGSIADNESGQYYGYRMSKAALNAASMSLTQDLKPRNISVGIYHPGYVATEMVGGRGDISPDVAAKRLATLFEQQCLASSGEFRHSNGEVLPW
ncbi:short-subunit dehydrogenase [Sinobacterium caligoides]|uniref:Short-subunit dehydrogenase n=1 Tax=Sinobacterium caligoides TaxID=933926 RepID=A0A3N2DPT3_9GAMM|nr:SDR family oxidoreductase [Sinobacterium caligoides]ROS01834.1 short-subunit dehydrogenase [Sinobacterium caligoides]